MTQRGEAATTTAPASQKPASYWSAWSACREFQRFSRSQHGLLRRGQGLGLAGLSGQSEVLDRPLKPRGSDEGSDRIIGENRLVLMGLEGDADFMETSLSVATVSHDAGHVDGRTIGDGDADLDRYTW
jgi:hypothetical protein